jgi:hypothetical protein
MLHEGRELICCVTYELFGEHGGRSQEKHAVRNRGRPTVKVGAFLILEKSYIGGEIVADGKAYRQFLKPGKPPGLFRCRENGLPGVL